jgi:hypothetical protein
VSGPRPPASAGVDTVLVVDDEVIARMVIFESYGIVAIRSSRPPTWMKHCTY